MFLLPMEPNAVQVQHLFVESVAYPEGGQEADHVREVPAARVVVSVQSLCVCERERTNSNYADK
jgi:hypothetical protein